MHIINIAFACIIAQLFYFHYSLCFVSQWARYPIQLEFRSSISNFARDSKYIGNKATSAPSFLRCGVDTESVEEHVNFLTTTLTQGAILLDKSSCGILSFEGDGRFQFLHSQTTNSFTEKASGVVPTCVVTNNGRIVDMCEALILEDKIMLLCSSERTSTLFEIFNKHLFPLDKVTLNNVSNEMAMFTLIGQKSEEIMKLAKLIDTDEIHSQLPSQIRKINWKENEVFVYSLTGLEPADKRQSAIGSATGYTIIAPISIGKDIKNYLCEINESILVGSSEDWNALCILQGRPSVDREISLDYNPLEAGLWQCIHFDKGCYMGQEMISKINGTNSVKIQLFGFILNGKSVSTGDTLYTISDEGNADSVAGLVTSVISMDKKMVGLAYIRRRVGGAGLQVCTADKDDHGDLISRDKGEIIDIPFARRSDGESAMPPRAITSKVAQDKTAESMAATKAKEKERKAAKLAEMQLKLEALQRKRGKSS